MARCTARYRKRREKATGKRGVMRRGGREKGEAEGETGAPEDPRRKRILSASRAVREERQVGHVLECLVTVLEKQTIGDSTPRQSPALAPHYGRPKP